MDTPFYKFEAERYDDQFSIIFWRAKLISDEYVPLVRIEPLSPDGVFICSSSFTVIQDGKQFDDIKLHSGDNDSYCNTLFVDKTLIFDQRFSTHKFDDKKAFTVVYDSLNVFRFEIPSLSGEGNIPGPINKPAIVNQFLGIYIPTAIFDEENIWVDLEYIGTDSNNEHNWRLKNYGLNQ